MVAAAAEVAWEVGLVAWKGCLVGCAAVVAPGTALWCHCWVASIWVLHQSLLLDGGA